MMARRLLRAAAILIALAGAVDPVWTRARNDRATISVVEAGDPALAASLVRRLAARHDVVAGADAGADATVIAGASWPAAMPPPAGALVAVVSDDVTRPQVVIERVAVAPVTAEASAASIDVQMVARGAAGRRVRVDALADGVAVDRRVQPVTADTQTLAVTLTTPALARGLTAIRVRVADEADGRVLAEASSATEVRAATWRVFVHDARPSWMSTFVRRALESDRRFVVAARQSVSKAVSTEAGAAPADLTAPGAIDAFDLVVIGAPDALSTAEVQALDRFARTRGGAVALLMDRADDGPFARLTGAAAFAVAPGVARRPVTGGGATMLATELAVPTRLSPLAMPLAATEAGPMIWSMPLGAGQVVVSAALDTWRYRATGANGFARFWSRALADAASAAPRPVEIAVARHVRAGGPVDVRVRIRAAALSPVDQPTAAVEARAAVIDAAGGRTVLRLWPAPERGVFVGRWTPPAPGRYRLEADAGVAEGAALGSDTADVLASTNSGVAIPDVAEWTRAHGGAVVTRADDATIEAALAARLSQAPRPAPWYPMRSPWWLPLFVLVLGGEWWLRRRGGDR